MGSGSGCAPSTGPGHSQDFVNDVASDAHGNVVAVGVVNYLALTPQVAAVVKYGAQGQRRWVRYYDDPNATAEQATNAVIDGAGNVYVAGESVASASGDDVFLVKYSSSGTRKWVRHFTGPGNGQDRIEDIARRRLRQRLPDGLQLQPDDRLRHGDAQVQAERHAKLDQAS